MLQEENTWLRIEDRDVALTPQEVKLLYKYDKNDKQFRKEDLREDEQAANKSLIEKHHFVHPTSNAFFLYPLGILAVKGLKKKKAVAIAARSSIKNESVG